jgi:hypothetical protein
LNNELSRGFALVCTFVLLGSRAAGAPGDDPGRPPTAQEQERLIAATRETVVAYSSRLPDFICTQTVKRTMVRGGRNLVVDTLTFETSYFRQRETNRLTHRNGVPVASEDVLLTGMSSRGEFGDNLLRIFAPNSEARFGFEKWTSVRGRRAVVLSYRVDRSQQPYVLTENHGGRMVPAVVGLRGKITVDVSDFSVLRVEYEADGIPGGFAIFSSKIAVEYANAEIGGKQYLLPARAEGVLGSSAGTSRNEAVFGKYRKFSTESVVGFSEPSARQ